MCVCVFAARSTCHTCTLQNIAHCKQIKSKRAHKNENPVGVDDCLTAPVSHNDASNKAALDDEWTFGILG